MKNYYYYLKSNRMAHDLRSTAAVASNSGANEFAPAPLRLAMDKMEGAEKAMRGIDYVLARKLAEQPQVDAELAGRNGELSQGAESSRCSA